MNNIPDCRYEYGNEENEPKVAFECTECGYSIYAGEKYLPIGDKIICRECLEDLMEEAEEEF
ncbi:TPA: hypothetical protein I9Z35_000461 [Clostridium perfringens]|nr:hypothetical protein [Clostridium perfringens]